MFGTPHILPPASSDSSAQLTTLTSSSSHPAESSASILHHRRTLCIGTCHDAQHLVIKVFSLYPNLLGKIYSVLFYLAVEDLSEENLMHEYMKSPF